MNFNNIKTWIMAVLATVLLTACNDDDSLFDGLDHYISSFELQQNGTILKAVISGDSITLKAKENLSLEGASATVVISENASIAPNPLTITDWNKAQSFLVTGHNGSGKTYKYSVVRSNVIHSGNIVLTTQNEVEAFAALEVSELKGSLTVGASEGMDSISSLESLSGLKRITSSLIINPTFSGTSLNGLENLEQAGSIEIGKFVNLQEATFPSLKSIMTNLTVANSTVKSLCFPKLENVDNSITLLRSDSLEQVDFSSLKLVANDFTIQGGWNDKAKLNSLSLPLLESVRGELNLMSLPKLLFVSIPKITTTTSVDINYCSNLESVSMPKLQETYQDVRIEGLDSITELDISSLTIVGRDFYLQNLPLIENVTMLKSLTAVGGRLMLSNLPLVANLSGLSSLTSTKEMIISSGFQSFTEFQSLNHTEFLQIAGSENQNVTEIDVTNIEGLSSLKIQDISSSFVLKGPTVFNGLLRIQSCDFELEGFLEVDNLGLYDFPAESGVTDKKLNIKKVNKSFSLNAKNMTGTYQFPELESVGGKLALNCQVPVSMPVLKEVGQLYSNLYSKDGESLNLPSLQTITSNCKIATSSYLGEELTDIQMPSLTTVGGLFTIAGSSYRPNTMLTNLNGISSLTSVTGMVSITYNSSLTDYSGLKNAIASFSSSSFTIRGNAYNPDYEDLAAGKWTPED